MVLVKPLFVDFSSIVRHSPNHGQWENAGPLSWIRVDMVEKGTIRLQYVPTEEQIADIFTKPLTAVKFVYFRDKLGMAENASLAKRECLF